MNTLKDLFLLDPSIIFLNHGSFGAVPKPVFKQYQSWQLELERQPVEFLSRRAPELLEEARKTLSNYVGAHYDDIVFTTNVTESINVVAHSLNLKPGDEVLATDMEYGAMNRTWNFLSQKMGYKYINHPINVPLTDPESYISQFWKAVTPHTRVIFLSHISSPTALLAPVKEIIQKAHQAGIITVIDGAHVPGQIELNIASLNVDFYGANLHKWLCAPKGSGFLYAHPRVQHLIEPLIVSWGWQSDTPGASKFIDYLQWTGTRDLSAFLSIAAAIQFQNDHHWALIRQRCHSLASFILQQLTQLTGIVPLYSPDSDWFAQMVACPLPANIDPQVLQRELYDHHRIEVPVLTWGNYHLIRVSFQAYNDENDAQRLLEALKVIILR